MDPAAPPYFPDCAELVAAALREDIGSGDITTLLTVPQTASATAIFTARGAGTAAGLPLIPLVFNQISPGVTCEFHVRDGDQIEPGQLLCTAVGPAQTILTGERVALNLLQRLSGIATITARFVALADGHKARIADTRKTTPGLRALEKYAVRAGGGHNHRFGLFDAVMIKDNHIAAAGSITAAVEAAQKSAPHTLTVTVECDSLEQVDEALAAGADILLLDNMDIETLREAVERIGEDAYTEASGGITESTVVEVAAAGVDVISVGALTHSAPSIDIGLDFTRH